MFFVTRRLVSGACNSKKQNSKHCVCSSDDFCTTRLPFFICLFDLGKLESSDISDEINL